jgi:hypothetical protein
VIVKAEYLDDQWVISGARPSRGWQPLGRHGMFLAAVILAQAAIKKPGWWT